MTLRRTIFVLCLCAGLPGLFAAPSSEPTVSAGRELPRFVAKGDGVFAFDTGVAKGQLRVDDRRIGVTSLIVGDTDVNIASGGGILNHYRVFSGSQRFGDGARGWPKTAKLLEDGGVHVVFDTGDYPFEMTATYRWAATDALDMQTTITPKRDLPDFELFMGSYFAVPTRGFLYTQPNQFEKVEAHLHPLDVNEMIDGAYLMFPRDQAAVRKIYDGRWQQEPHPVRWSVPRWSAGALGVRRHKDEPVVVGVMARPQQCFAIAGPYNKTPPDGPAAHASLYHSLYGRDLAAGEPATVDMRMIFGRSLSDQQIIARYASYVK